MVLAVSASHLASRERMSEISSLPSPEETKEYFTWAMNSISLVTQFLPDSGPLPGYDATTYVNLPWDGY